MASGFRAIEGISGILATPAQILPLLVRQSAFPESVVLGVYDCFSEQLADEWWNLKTKALSLF